MKTLFASVAVLAFAASANAAPLTIDIVPVPGNPGVFQAEVTNPAGNGDVFGIDLGGIAGPGDGGFEGNFAQNAEPVFGSPLAFSTASTTGTIAGFSETYFFFNGGDVVSINTIDNSTRLESAFGAGPSVTTPLIADGATEIVAIFTTTDGIAPTFLGGEVDTTDAGVQPIIPEPATAALLGLGGLAMLRRRRA